MTALAVVALLCFQKLERHPVHFLPGPGWLLVRDGPDSLALHRVKDGEQVDHFRDIGSVYAPSPKGGRLASVWNSQLRLSLMNPERRVWDSDDPSLDTALGLAFSADEATLLAVCFDDALVYAVTGQLKRRIPCPPGDDWAGGAISPDGMKAALVTDDGHLWLADTATGMKQRVAKHAIGTPCFSSDGKKLAFRDPRFNDIVLMDTSAPHGFIRSKGGPGWKRIDAAGDGSFLLWAKRCRC